MSSAEQHAATHGLECLELECNQTLFEERGAAQDLGAIAADALEIIRQRSP